MDTGSFRYRKPDRSEDEDGWTAEQRRHFRQAINRLARAEPEPDQPQPKG